MAPWFAHLSSTCSPSKTRHVLWFQLIPAGSERPQHAPFSMDSSSFLHFFWDWKWSSFCPVIGLNQVPWQFPHFDSELGVEYSGCAYVIMCLHIYVTIAVLMIDFGKKKDQGTWNCTGKEKNGLNVTTLQINIRRNPERGSASWSRGQYSWTPFWREDLIFHG